mmetsp:Transcript_12027/g.22504  ORF Transcript_12027/g.22504 Transcript_12027/m.22504 type:complete len:923 (-) Transcript_12027:50-2818(-)
MTTNSTVSSNSDKSSHSNKSEELSVDHEESKSVNNSDVEVSGSPVEDLNHSDDGVPNNSSEEPYGDISPTQEQAALEKEVFSNNPTNVQQSSSQSSSIGIKSSVNVGAYKQDENGERTDNNVNNNGMLGFFSLTKKKKTFLPPKIQSSGVVNYGVGHSDSESDASSLSVASTSNGYELPYSMLTGDGKKRVTFSSVDSVEGEDDRSIRTPIPTGPPETSAVLPSAFLRNRSGSMSTISDLSEEESSVVKRQKREEENVGRLVQAAKQQQSFAQAWFSAGKSENANALPKYVPPKNRIPSNAPADLKKKKTSFKDTERPTGPIDLDSGDVWEGEGEQASKTNWEVGSFNFTTHSGTTKKRKNQGFITFGVPDDEDLTTYYQGEVKCGDRVVCTIGNTRCTLLALIVVSLGLILVIVGGTISGLYLSRNPVVIESSAPSVSPSPTMTQVPSISPTEIPTRLPSLRPTAVPTPTPSYHPSSAPSPSPSLSLHPTDAPSSAPTTFFSDEVFSIVGQTIKINAPNGGFGQVVSMNESGTIVAVGALYYPNNKGSITVFELINGNWTQKGNVIEGLSELSQFGPSVDLSQDGLTLVMGEGGSLVTQDLDTVRVFEFNGTTSTWDQLGGMIQGDPVQNIQFGFSVAISDDGSIVAVGAPLQNIRSGKVYTFRRVGNAWESIADITNLVPFSVFGYSVSLSGDGKTLACGAPEGTTDPLSFTQNGYVQIYQLFEGSGIASEWIPYGGDINYEGSLKDELFARQQARFGESVSLSKDGSRLAIGAVDDKVFSNEQSGSASVYKIISGKYERMGGIMVGNPGTNQQFGQSVAISWDGMYVVVGAVSAQTGLFKGEVFIHRYNGKEWDPAESIKGENQEQFGNSVAITVEKIGSDEEKVIVSAGGPFSGLIGDGVARIYQWQGLQPSLPSRRH